MFQMEVRHQSQPICLTSKSLQTPNRSICSAKAKKEHQVPPQHKPVYTSPQVIKCALEPLGRYRSNENWFQKHSHICKRQFTSILKQIQTFRQILGHPRVPWFAKAVAACSLGYLVSPVQLIPTFLPVVGQMDDLFVVFLGMTLVRRLTPPEVLKECERGDQPDVFVRGAQRIGFDRRLQWNLPDQ
jgi:uncharacterized membrane protein YkvA (DUF1232 family)